MPEVVVVGAGQCGLIISARLAADGIATTLIERLPQAGGQEPEHPLVDGLTARAEEAGAVLVLGTAAVSFDGSHVHSLGVDGARHDPADVLVVATGTRPSTRAELGIDGDRCAGILPGSAAVHLTESGVLLGHAPAVIGGGGLAAECAHLLARAGAQTVTLIAPDGLTVEPPRGTRVLEGWKVETAQGRARVSHLVLRRGPERMDLAVDAAILAGGRVPMRNIEGAVLPGPRVVFCHSQADPKSEADAAATVDEALTAVTAALRATPTGTFTHTPEEV